VSTILLPLNKKSFSILAPQIPLLLHYCLEPDILTASNITTIIPAMKPNSQHSKPLTLFLATRPKFLIASAAPIFVGTTLACATNSSFNPLLFVLALLAIMTIHAGANMTNDYFDHTSKNDWLNKNPTPFSGGRRYIQQGVISPKATLITALTLLTAGGAIGLVIVLLTRSIFILILGLLGLLGAFFYTAPPIRLGYRSTGEPVIALLFGLLPVYASYYLQTRTIDCVPLLPACILAILIFLVIFINDFPDFAADKAVNKKTLVVRFGIPASLWIYRTALFASFCVAAAAILIDRTFIFAGSLYLLTLPLAVVAARLVNKEELAKPGRYRANQITILLHTLGALTLTAGFIVSALIA
jgi:1,4-dihydroxy-2-naphthoate octaprenyltransferase